MTGWNRIATLVIALAMAAGAQVEGVSLRQAAGGHVVGTLVSVDRRSARLVIDGAERTFPLDAVVALGLGTPELSPPGPASPLLRFELANGDVLYGRIVDSDYDQVRVESEPFGTVTVPLDTLAQATVLRHVSGIPRRFGADVPTDRDVVFVRSKEGVDHVIGDVARFQRDGVLFEWSAAGETPFLFEKDRVVAVRLAEPEARPAPSGVACRVHATDGSVLTGSLSMKPDGPLLLELADGARIVLRPAELARIGFASSRFSHLGLREPERIEETPYLEGALTYGVRVDEGLDGGPPTISERLMTRSILVHTRCAITWKLAEGDRVFSTAIGLDGVVAHRPVKGAVRFSVLVDGKTVAGPILMRAGEAPRWIEDVEVGQGETITLLADFADNFHFNGWAVWGEPVLSNPE